MSTDSESGLPRPPRTAQADTDPVVLEAQERLSSLFHGVPVGLFRTTPEGQFILANQSLVEMFGYSNLSEFQQVNAQDFYIDPRQRAEILRPVNDAPGFVTLEVEVQRRDGSAFWVRSSMRAVRDDQGEIVFYEGSISDINDLKQAERGRAAAEELFRKAFEEAPIPMTIGSADGCLVKVNRAMCELLGYGEEELLELGWLAILHPDDREAGLERIQLFRHGVSKFQFVSRYVRAGGGAVRARVSVSTVLDSEGDRRSLAQFVPLGGDVWDTAAGGSVDDRTEFTSAVSQELRTALASIVGYAELLESRAEAVDADRASEVSSVLVQQARDAAAMVEDLFVASQRTDGDIAFARHLVNVDEAIFAAVAELPVVSASRVRWAPSGAVVWADSQRVRQILRNLLQNGLRYGGEDVSIEVETGSDYTLVSVIDDGRGIPDHQVEAIFEPVTRSPSAGSPLGSVGIGLSVSKYLAKQMGGSLSYYRVDDLTIFALDLPSVGGRSST
jgi:PAS domain S-box-containing protein